MDRDKLVQTFIEEAHELLLSLEEAILELEENPSDMDLVSHIFRVMHTIKGSGAMYGFDDIAGLTHEVETIFDMVRNAEMAVSEELIDLTLKARDLLRQALDNPDEASMEFKAHANALMVRFKGLSHDKKNTVLSEEASSERCKSAGVQTNKESAYRIFFRPGNDIFCRGIDPRTLLEELRRLGHAEVLAKVEHIPPIEDLDPEQNYMAWEILLTTRAELNAVKDVFIFVEDCAELTIEPVGGPQVNSESPVGADEAVHSCAASRGNGAHESTIRVSSGRLDNLVDLVGELVTIQATLSQLVAGWDELDLFDLSANAARHELVGPEVLVRLYSLSEQFERLAGDIRERTMSLRMVPFSSNFYQFKRLVRDLSRDLGKEVDFVTKGGDTEFDKNMIERIGDVMVHLIRNCIDHGMESPAEREAAGKAPRGTVQVIARHDGPDVIISISDDGRGINLNTIRDKAVLSGIISADRELSDDSLLQLIFLPGFSTAAEVSGVSGRGVGMDVVKRTIEELRGSVQVESEVGVGTIFRIRLPLTLAIIDGLLVTIGQTPFVLPLSMIEECIEIPFNDVVMGQENNLVEVRGELVPYINLRTVFGVDSAPPEHFLIAIANIEGVRVGFVVDSVVGKHQTVIKSMSSMYRHVRHVSGATILGDGNVALILDVKQLLDVAERSDAARHQTA